MAEQHELLQARVSRRGVLKGAALLSAGPLLLRTAAASAAAPMGARWIGYGDDPQTTMNVNTSIASSFRNATVEYGVDGSFGQSAQFDVGGVAGVTTRYGSARLTGLTPGTQYSYRVRVDGQSSATATFATAPAQPGPFTFTAFGDEGTSQVSSAIVGQLKAVQPRFHLLAGDLCYADIGGKGLPTDEFKPKQWDRWLSIIEPVAASTPWMTAVGNHDMEPGFGAQGYDGYLARFALPRTGATGCPSTYHFRYGAVAFIQVDSNDVSWEIPHNLGYSHGTQDTWLESVLRQYRQPGSGIDFIVVTMHHCAYSTARSHGSEGGVRARWTGLFDKYSVDLVISGHNHSYERSHPIRAGHVTEQSPSGSSINSTRGTTYLTVGGGGASLNTLGFTRGSYLLSDPGTAHTHKFETIQGTAFSALTDQSYCYAVCKVTPGSPGVSPTLAITINDPNGNRLDTVRLVRAGAESSTVTDSGGGGGSDTGLVIGVGAGAATLAAVGGAGYVWHRRHSEYY